MEWYILALLWLLHLNSFSRMNIKRGGGDTIRDKSPLKTFLQKVCPCSLICLIFKKKALLSEKKFLLFLSHPPASENILLDNSGYSKFISCQTVYIPSRFCRF